MRRLINWFKHLDNTKKVVIAFVSISFAMILSITIFNMASGSNVEQKTNVSQKQTKKKTDNKKEKSETTKEEAVIEEDKTTEETTDETSNVETNRNSNSETNKSDPSNAENAPVVQYINISVSIVGMNDEVIALENIAIEQGTTAYDCLKQFTSIRGIDMESSGFAYVTNIAGLKEKEHGFSSGWMYKINGVNPYQSSGQYTLNDGDQMEWYYVYD